MKKKQPNLLLPFLLLFALSLFLNQDLFPLEKGKVFGLHTEIFEAPTINETPVVLPDPAFYPEKSTTVPAPFVSAVSAIVLDVDSQVVLYKKNENQRLPPASTTKIMTALVGMDYFTLDDTVVVDDIVVEGAAMELAPGEQISFRSLLYGLMLASGNDAAEVIAHKATGDRKTFIATMNKKAKELNLGSTHFNDPTGLSSANYTSALDLARLASFALKNQQLATVVATKKITVSDLTGKHLHELENINKLLGEVEGVRGFKTGFTEEAGEVLVTAATRDNHTLITVVLHSQDRFLDSKNLLEWAFANHMFLPATGSIHR